MMLANMYGCYLELIFKWNLLDDWINKVYFKNKGFFFNITIDKHEMKLASCMNDHATVLCLNYIAIACRD